MNGAVSVAGALCVPPEQEAGLSDVVTVSLDDDSQGHCAATNFDGSLTQLLHCDAKLATQFRFDHPMPDLEPLPLSQWFTERGLPPVVRGQSPDIQLLGLADDAVTIEKTSVLSAVTGTKGRLRGDYLTDFDQTDRIGVQLLTQGWLGIGLDTEANYWQRPVPDLGQETLWTGDLNLIYNLVPHPRFKLRSGVGAAWAIDDGKLHAGYNVTHGLDVYLLWRAMATGEIDWGTIDDDKLFRYRLALGLTVGSAEFYTGYESLRLGAERLDGWVNGVAIWY